MKNTPNPAPRSSGMSLRGLLVSAAALLVSAGVYYADIYNLPGLAPWLDYLSDRILDAVPLSRIFPVPLPPQTPFLVSAAAVGFVFFLVATIAAAILFPSTGQSRLEKQLAGRNGSIEKHRGGIAS
jgi:hypothetical protein